MTYTKATFKRLTAPFWLSEMPHTQLYLKDSDMALVRIEVTYEFCVDAPDKESALEVFHNQHTLAIDDHRCGVVHGPEVSAVQSSLDFEESTLDEVPLGAFDETLRERFSKEG